MNAMIFRKLSEFIQKALFSPTPRSSVYFGIKPNRYSSSRGASFVALVIGMPIFLVMIMAMLWTAVMMNSKSTLQAATEMGVRLASTRGNSALIGELDPAPDNVNGVIDPLNKYHNNDVTWEDVKHLLATPDLQDLPDSEDLYDDWSAMVFRKCLDPDTQLVVKPCILRTMPTEYIYALVYIGQLMRESLGSSVRFPCDPEGSGSNDGPGCLACKFANPDAGEDDPPIPVFAGYSSCPAMDGNNYCFPPHNEIRIVCTYEPDQFLIRPIFALLSLIIGETNIPRFILKQEIYHTLAETQTAD